MDNELYCYSNEFHSHLPFDRLSQKLKLNVSNAPFLIDVCLTTLKNDAQMQLAYKPNALISIYTLNLYKRDLRLYM